MCSSQQQTATIIIKININRQTMKISGGGG
jgi:hypothetical protein